VNRLMTTSRSDYRLAYRLPRPSDRPSPFRGRGGCRQKAGCGRADEVLLLARGCHLGQKNRVKSIAYV
jgi:hypothetical protein